MVNFLIISILSIFLLTDSGQRGDISAAADEGSWTDSLSASTSAEDSMRTCYMAAQKSIFADTVMKYSQIMLPLATQLHDTIMIADAYSTIGWAYSYHGNIDSSIASYQKAYSTASKAKDKQRMAKALYNIAYNYNDLNKFSASLQKYQESLLMYEELKDYKNIALIQRDLAIRDIFMKQYAAAEKKLDKAIELDTRNHDTIALAEDLYILIQMQFYENKKTITIEQLQYLDSKAEIIGATAARTSDKLEKGNLTYEFFHVKAILHTKKYALDHQHWHIDSAYNYCDQALQYQYAVYDVNKIATIQIQKANTSYAEQKGHIGIQITDQIKQRYLDSLNLQNKMALYKAASQCHEDVRDFEKAYVDICEYFKCYIQYVDNLNVVENADFNAKINIQKLRNQSEITNQKNAEEINRQKNYTIFTSIVITIGTIILIIILIELRRRHTSNIILNDQNKQLNRQREEITAQRNVIEEQRQAAERANLITYQSIRYAKHIQNAALPSEEHIRRIFPEHFIYYEPKDIVSGDFYYATQNAGLDIFVLADCTGHGVPGGFLSMLGISAIQELLKNPEIDIMPGIILDMMREYIKQVLANDEDMAEAIARGEESFSTADGMDMSIVAYDKYNHCLRFAGAYQSLYIVRNGEITRLKGDRMPVGRHINEAASFQTQLFETQEGDMVYMSSDGIPSQIGFAGVKFMSKRLMDFFKSNYTLPCETQKRNITNIMNDWLFGTPQIDDLSLIGIRIVE